ncbi:DUF1254 domain-containing protein [Curtobacterium sp. L3-7]|uniref:DUF1254 domain-containing protein n=1 Tax=Curtobacterium sp. L3-7 TaxID=3138787 RepID=UPI003B52D8C8
MSETAAQTTNTPYEFVGGYPTEETIQRAHDEADFNRAVQAYRYFYPSVSMVAVWKADLRAGAEANRVFALLEGTPKQYVFTPNSDTPYSGLLLDLSDGPMVMELPPGPLMSTVNDLNQRWILDAGLPGPDKGAGGRHLVLPPGFDGDVPDGYNVGRATTNRVMVLLRALPIENDDAGAVALMQSVKVSRLGDEPTVAEWVDLTALEDEDFTPVPWEDNLEYWNVLAEFIRSEPPFAEYRAQYGELAELGIRRDRPFEPDERMRGILERAAVAGHAQLAVQSFADRRPERVVWPDTKWEWAVLRPENGTFDTADYADSYARQKWFYQAQIESPAMFARSQGAGSLYWLGMRDASGAYLDGGKTYVLDVPQPVPAKLFWSITVYDARTRSEIRTEQNLAALRSQVELRDLPDGDAVRLLFGPAAPEADDAKRWIQTLPDVGWFAYFRIYGPDSAAFDGSWQLPDFDRTS